MKELKTATTLYVQRALQYGSAKSVANIAGMVAANVLRGDHPVVHWAEVDWAALTADPQALIVDVREVSEPTDDSSALKGCVCMVLAGLSVKGRSAHALGDNAAAAAAASRMLRRRVTVRPTPHCCCCRLDPAALTLAAVRGGAGRN